MNNKAKLKKSYTPVPLFSKDLTFNMVIGFSNHILLKSPYVILNINRYTKESYLLKIQSILTGSILHIDESYKIFKVNSI